MLEQSHDVGERLVEGLDVTVRRLVEARVNAVEKGMRGLVRDDVVRETREDDRPRCVVLVLRGDWEVAEKERLLGGRVVGIAVTKRVRVDAQPSHELPVVLAFRPPHAPISPERLAAKGTLKVLDRGHRDRVDHLLVKLGIRLGRRMPVSRKKVRIVEVDRIVEDAARRVDVDDLDVFPDRAGLELFPGDCDRDLVERRRRNARREARVESEYP